MDLFIAIGDYVNTYVDTGCARSLEIAQLLVEQMDDAVLALGG